MSLEEEQNPDIALISHGTGLTIKIGMIEKLETPKKILIKVDLKGSNLGCSQIITVLSSEAEVNWEVFYEVPELTESVIDDLIGHPLVFSVLYEDSSISPISQFKKAEGNRKKSKQKKTTPSRSSSRTREFSVGSVSMKMVKSTPSFSVLGIANLDLLPLLTGRDEMREVLLVQPPVDLRGSQAIAWTNLPRMEVTISSSGNFSRMILDRVCNVLFFTLESLQNVTPEFVSGDVQVATIFPRNQDFEVAKFTNSYIGDESPAQPYKRKKWFGLSEMQGPAALSSYKVCKDNLEHSMEHNITSEMLECRPKVQWHQLHRSNLTQESQEKLKNKLIEHRCWPLEIIILNSTEKVKTSTSKKDILSDKGLIANEVNKAMEESNIKSKHYLAFVDLTKLLYPGATTCRVAAHLYFYQDGLMEKRFGSEHKMFESPRLPTAVKVEKPTKSVSSKKDQSKPATPKSPVKETITTNVDVINNDSTLPPEPVQVYNLEGEPVFIIVQVEVLNPLIKKKTIEETLRSIQSIVPLRAQPTGAQQAVTTCTKDFDLCIEQLMHVLHDEYQFFYSENRQDSLLKMAKTFLMHLHLTGAYTKMKESIRESVEAYITGAIGCPKELDITRPNHQGALSNIYFSMVKKMCDTVNSLPSLLSEYDPEIPYDDLLYFAVEAVEEDMFDKGQQYLLQRLEKSKKADPQAWLDYARLWLKKHEFEKAGECVKKAISIDSRFIPALFFQGLLSWLTEDFVEAEVFLLAVSSLDPHMPEVWIVLYMFHKQMDNQLLAKTELNYGRASIKGKILLSEESADPVLSWRHIVADPHRVFLVTASHLLRLSFPELAELALSYDLLEYGRSVDYLYYLAICHYQQGRYSDSLKHLDEALKNVWEDGYLWALEGHNFYKLKKYPEATQAYEFALNFNLPPIDTRLLNLRLGNIHSNVGDFERAHHSYLSVCQVHGSPLSWQGLGITAFMNDELNDAELALNEANMLDCRLPRVWGYLALINLMWSRPNVFNQCVSQAIRYGLDDPVLLERLNILGEFVQPTTHM